MDSHSRLFELDHLFTSDDWYTPPWVFEGLAVEFDMDVAAPPSGVPWIPAKEAIDETRDGLAVPWTGLVWCNPPYSAPTPWCRIWAAHPTGLILLRADLSGSGVFVALTAAHALWVPKGRLQFVKGDGSPQPTTTFSTVMLGRGTEALHAMERLTGAAGGVFKRFVGPGGYDVEIDGEVVHYDD